MISFILIWMTLASGKTLSYRAVDPPMGLRVEKVILQELKKGIAHIEIKGRHRNLNSERQRFRVILVKSRNEIGSAKGHLKATSSGNFSVMVKISVKEEGMTGVRAHIEFN